MMPRCKHNIDVRWCSYCSPPSATATTINRPTTRVQRAPTRIRMIPLPPEEKPYPAKLPAELHTVYDAVLVAERDGRMTRFMVRHERLWWTLTEIFQLLRPAQARCYKSPEELAQRWCRSSEEIREQFQSALTQLGIVTS